jgi:L-2-hydroxycarboxylate dehydrogenase (NAD+)
MPDDVTLLPRVSHAALIDFIVSAYRAAGIAPGDAQKAAELMAQSDISGADGHGVFRLPQYIRRIQQGGLNTRPNITVSRTAPGTALIDGDNGLGSLVVARAVETAIEIAGSQGVGWAGTRRGNHAGAAAVYAAMPVPHDMIGIYFAVGNANHLPPWGGIDMLLSTNPLAIAVPALEEPPLVLDMATTVAAYGKVKVAAQQGKTMPEGWMIDREGQPLTDPNRADDGFLLPIGGYKGAAMSLMFGLLAGTLNGAANGEDVVDFNKDDTTRPIPARRSACSTSPASPSRPRSSARSTRSSASCTARRCSPASTAFACPARTAPRASPSAPGAASRSPVRSRPRSTRWPANWGSPDCWGERDAPVGVHRRRGSSGPVPRSLLLNSAAPRTRRPPP